MGTLIEDAVAGAEWVATALTASGYQADFSARSLSEIDRFFDDHARGGQPVPGGLLAEQFGFRIFAIGGYVGEVIRRGIGGEWVFDENDPQNELNLALRLPDGSVVWPMQRAFKRFRNGSEDGIAVYAAVLGLAGGMTVTPMSLDELRSMVTPDRPTLRPPVPPAL